MIQNISDYWHSLEFFRPVYPALLPEDTDLHREALPWTQKEPAEQIRKNYDIYLGRAGSYDLDAWVAGQMNLSEDDIQTEQYNPPVCICALKADQNGYYIPASFSASAFVWALGRMIITNDFSASLDNEFFEDFQNQYDSALTELSRPFSLEDLDNLLLSVYECSGLPPGMLEPAVLAQSRTHHKQTETESAPAVPCGKLLQSSYLKDIDKIRTEPGEKIKKYTQAAGLRHQPVHIDVRTDEMQKWLQAGRFPRGIWPSGHTLNLMQQIAVNISVSDQETFSVTAPPGSGKSAVLKEIIAANVTARAELLSEYTNPDDAFSRIGFINPPDKLNEVFYRPDERLTGYGILAAAGSGEAAMNIAAGLSEIICEDRTGLFTDTDDITKTYFSDIASELNNKPAWGLISVYLGRTENITALRDILLNSAAPENYFRQTPPDWETARREFLAVREEQKKICEKIEKVPALLKKFAAAEKAESEGRKNFLRVQRRLNKQLSACEKLEKNISELEESSAVQQLNTERFKSELRLFKRLFPWMFRKDPEVREWKNTELRSSEILKEAAQKRNILRIELEKLENVQSQVQQRLMHLKKKQRALQILQRMAMNEKERFGNNFADEKFWKDIAFNEASQSACPWVYEEYDRIREELFCKALMLHKAFVLSSRSAKHNLISLCSMLDGRFSCEDKEAAYGCLLNTLFFAVPLISSELGSLQTFLDGIQQDELGVLVIDEAGQVPPQSALGALRRTRRTIAFGDSLQAEPVMTVPALLHRRLADDNNIEKEYRAPGFSFQQLADSLNNYIGNTGPYRGGCPLRIHKRCIEPMFSISNGTAYSGQMFAQTPPVPENTKLLLGKSFWFDVKGEQLGSGNHTVINQINLTQELIKTAAELFEGFPDELFIITPFASVSSSLKSMLSELLPALLPEADERSISSWISRHCGTIHTFQGRAANEALLVMGCDIKSGKGAAEQTGQSVNFINTAVTCAGYRIGVIGDYDLWKNIPNIQNVCGELKNDIIEY